MTRLAVGMECRAELPHGRATTAPGASLAPRPSPVWGPGASSLGAALRSGEMGRVGGGPAAAGVAGPSGSRPGEKLYIHQNLKQKPHSSLSARLWLLW